MELKPLIQKYSGPGPRYTSYPTAPQWQSSIEVPQYHERLTRLNTSPHLPLGMYVHLPFCESLCYYCGCNIQITKDKSRSSSYVDSVIKEIEATAATFKTTRNLSQISWGGGTPTFLTLNEISLLYSAIKKYFHILPNADVSLEVDPRVTSQEQLSLLKELGFNRVSLGVQDFNSEVQKAIHRIQSAESTYDMLSYSRKLGYQGINFDLIYGLPFQTNETFQKTISQVIEMKPDRIALFNYARLPSMIPHQKIMEKFPMPSPEERIELFTMAFQNLTQAGYVAIGMDHFALANDSLAKALPEKTLYRNFMGYVVGMTENLMGIGASAIGEISEGYFQNIKNPAEYETKVNVPKENSFGLATLRGWLCTPDDLKRKWIIQSLMCRFELNPQDYEERFHCSWKTDFAEEEKQLEPFLVDGILLKTDSGWQVTELGRLFIRNIAMVFDAYLTSPKNKSLFSQTV